MRFVSASEALPAMATSFTDVVADHPLVVCVSFVGLAVGTVVSGLVLRSYQRRARSLRRSVLVVALSSLAIAVFAAVIAARLMLLSRGELGSFLAVLGVAAGFAALLAVVVSRPMRDDVRQLEAAVRTIESGDRSVRVNSRRGDELGHVGRAIDDLVSRLDRLEHERVANEQERQSLITNIGHDLRSPLAALQAAVEALIDGVAPDPQRYLRSMQHDVTALSALIDDLSLLSRLDAGRYKGTVTVKVGPATMSFRGEVEMKDVDPAARTLRLLGKGTDSTGSSGASMNLTARIEAAEGGFCALVGASEVSMSGKAAAFGGRMMNTVADQILKQFADNFAGQVSALQAQRAAPAAAGSGAPAAAASIPPPAAGELNALALVWTIIKDWLRGLFSRKTA